MTKLSFDLSTYARGKQSGRKFHDCDDQVAEELRGVALADVYAHVARTISYLNGEPVDLIFDSLQGKYSHLNPGMQRMNLANRLRNLNGRVNATPAISVLAARSAPKVESVPSDSALGSQMAEVVQSTLESLESPKVKKSRARKKS